MEYLRRTIEPVVEKAVKEFPAVVITGPRQAGKTTLLKHLFKGRYKYVSLEPPDVRAGAQADPRGFLELFSSPVIFDEIQYAPELLPYIKEKIDENREVHGQFILTGSQNLLLLEQVSETLAGRCAMLTMLPLSYAETQKQPERNFVWEREEKELPFELQGFWQGLLRGSYPELIQQPDRDFLLWQGSYVQTYLERDVRSLRQVGDLTQFQLFIRAIAARSAQLFHLSDVAKDLGVAVNTIKAWLAVLEATYQIVILRPYFNNSNKRLVKSPKVFFTDVGTLCYHLGLRDAEHLRSGPMAGAVVETFVFSEVYKRICGRGRVPQLYFWRTSSGTEVDIIVQDQGKLIPVEVKMSSTPTRRMASGMESFRKSHTEVSEKGYVVHLGEMILPLGKDILAMPFKNL